MPDLLPAALLARRAEAAAQALRRLGVRAGEPVALLGAASAAYAGALAGLWRLGALAVPLSPREPPGALATRVQVARAIRVLAGSDVDLAGLDALGLPLMAMPDETAVESSAVPVPPGEEVPAALVFTSGSTGVPKAAKLSHGALRASARGVAAAISFRESSAWALALPLHHVGGLGVVVRAMEAGGALVVPEPGEALAAVLAHPACTHASLVATQLRRLMAEAPEVLEGKTILLGGSAIPAPLLDAAHARGLRVVTSYGLTEMASTVTATPVGGTRADLATSGTALPDREVRISGDGELLVRGATRFSGYRTADGFVTPFDADGYFATGDLGHFDAAGRLVVSGRRDLMFVSGGENIHPERIERALLALPGVEEAVVVAVPDPAFEHRPFAFVRAATLDGARIRAALRETLPGFLVPVGVAALPETEGLKPARATLQALAVRHHAEAPGGAGQ